MTRLGERIKTNLKAARIAADWTQERLAQESGVSSATIARIEQGRTGRPRDAELAKIAAALSTTPEALMGIADDWATKPDEGEPSDIFRAELARRYGPENADFVHEVGAKLQGLQGREAEFVRRLLMGAVRAAATPWRSSHDGATDIATMAGANAPARS